MSLIELHAANALLDDPDTLAARYRQEGCLLVRGALDRDTLAGVADEATELLERWGVGGGGDGLRATGAPLPSLGPAERPDLPGLRALADDIAAGTDPIAPIAVRAFGCPAALWPGAQLHVVLPGRETPAHQDTGALDWIGDYRRFWIALGDVPFGDGGLGLAAGSHRYRRLRMDELIDGKWSTAAMSMGDLLVFDLNLVHRTLPARSDRIRVALSVIGSAQWDPRPSAAAHEAGRAPCGLCEQDAIAV